MRDIFHDRLADSGAHIPAAAGRLARQRAMAQIGRRRRSWIGAGVGTLGVIVLAVIWAVSEYHNAGGRPAQGSARVLALRMCGTTGSSTPGRGEG
jgi:hypothetical protein